MAEAYIPVSEELLIRRVEEPNAAAVLTTTVGRGQTAAHLAQKYPMAKVVCHFLDEYPLNQTREELATSGSRVEVVCQSDLPNECYTLAALPFLHRSDSELTRDLLQQAYERLALGGVLYTSVDAEKDTWLHHELEKLGKSITRYDYKAGVVYKLQKKEELKKQKDFRCQFAFRDQDRLIQVISRPGVFSHRRLDLGARALMEAMTVLPGYRVLDIGCGAGTVSLAAAFRAEDVRVDSIDSHCRAVECVLEGAKLNELSNIEAWQTTEGKLKEEGCYDVVLGNPPYYSHFRIAEIFLQTAARAVKPGGMVHMVAKNVDWMQERMQELFKNVNVETRRTYKVVVGQGK